MPKPDACRRKALFGAEARLSWVLAGLAGLIGAAAFAHTAGYFVTFMTGNTDRAILGYFRDEPEMAVAALCLIAAFVAGVVVASWCRRRYWTGRSTPVSGPALWWVACSAWWWWGGRCWSPRPGCALSSPDTPISIWIGTDRSRNDLIGAVPHRDPLLSGVVAGLVHRPISGRQTDSGNVFRRGPDFGA
ncbi:DUF1275 family protein [Nocardia sp. NPDC004568]|uniref:DUF1275 family protein n=1 Tax=Nocardia sp. NPDC004568 TaxID=3154551 RepID=UPI0033A7444E